jgi:hypothetical protein
MRHRHKTARVATAAGLIAAVALLGACSKPIVAPSTSSSPTPTQTASTTASASVDPTVAAASAAVEEAYRGYWSAKLAVFADPTKEAGADLSHYAVDTAYSDTVASMLTFRGSGIAFLGSPSLSPVVQGVDLTAQTATITDCVDSTNWRPVYTATGATAAAPGQAQRLVAKADAYVYDGHWTIRTFTVNRETPC